MTDLKHTSPLEIYREHLRRGELAYQLDGDGAPVFHPRATLAAGAALRWKVSAGRGTVYATTVVAQRDAPDYNVALVELDEGFRMMSRVEEIEPLAVRIGLRVRLRVARDADGEPLPVFVPERAP